MLPCVSALKNIKCSTLLGWFLLCLSLCILPCRCGWTVLVREQFWAGVLRRWGPRGFLSGAPGAWSPRHPWQEWQIPAWRPGRHVEGRWTLPEQLSSVGVLRWSNIGPKPRLRLNSSLNSVEFWGGRQFLLSEELQLVLISSHVFFFFFFLLFHRGCNRELTEITDSYMGDEVQEEELTVHIQSRNVLIKWTTFGVSAWPQQTAKLDHFRVLCCSFRFLFQWAFASLFNYCLVLKYK